MKGKYLLGGLVMALLGAVIALFAYTRIYGNPSENQQNYYTANDHSDSSAMLTSYPAQQGEPVDFTYAAERTVHAVVHVHITANVGSQPDNPIMEFFYGDRGRQEPQQVQGYGSGVIISPDGYIVTNNHVIEDAEKVEVKLNDNRVFPAEVVGRDPSTDIALLKIKADNLEFIKYGDSGQLKIGEWVLAVGNPFNLTSTVTAGIISAKGRSNLGINEGDARIESFIQTDAALNMGNSGGALVNTKGLLVGITSAILSPSGAYAGASFAVPVEIVQKVVDDLREFGEVQRVIIGVNIRDLTADDADKEKLKEIKGVFVTNVMEKSSAEEAGLKENDIIIAFNGVPVNTASDLQVQVSKFRPGDKATITYIRNASEKTVPIKLKNMSGNTNVVTADMRSVSVLGARLEALSADDKKALDVDYGVKITEIGAGRFRDIGMKRGNIILSINGQKLKSPTDAREASSKGMKSIEGIQSDGQYFNYQFGR